LLAVGGASAFEGLMATLDYPMFIVTVRMGTQRAGCLVGFATQASIDPPRFLVGLSDKNRTYRVARYAEHLAVHFVPETAADLAELFGGETGDEVDKFARCAWHEGPHGLPILDACENWFVGRIRDRMPFGDHLGFLLEPVVAQHGSKGRQFTFHRAKRIDPGHDP
jgi:flavin reductase (DIM6/NTAB) family NADH-FMN oxidoreductase RutF